MVGKLINILLSTSQQNNPIGSPICPTDDPHTNLSISNTAQYGHGWCTFEAVDQMTVRVEQVYLFVVFVQFVYFMGLFFKLVHERRDPPNRRFFGDQFVKIYKIITVWFGSTFIRVGICVAVYHAFMEPDFGNKQMPDTNDPSKGQAIVILASIYNFFNFFCAFVVDFLIIFIPYKWLSNLLQNINHESRLLTIEKRKKIDTFNKILIVVRIYYKFVRNFIALVVFSQAFVFFFTEFYNKCKMPLYNYGYTIVQTLLLLAFYIFAVYVLHYLRKISLITIKYKDLRDIVIEYTLLLISLLARIALDIYSFIMIEFPNKQRMYTPNNHCADMNTLNDVEFVVTLTLHHLLMHILPIFVVIYIYFPKISNKPSQIMSRIEYHDNLLTQQLISPTMSFTSTQRANQSNAQSKLKSSASSIFNQTLQQSLPTQKSNKR